MGSPPRIPVWLPWEQRVIYFVTICVENRQCVLANHPAFAAFKTAIDRLRHWRVLAATLMPDHMHALLEGLTDESDFRRCTKMAKQRSGAAYALTSETPLWQKGYYEHVLRDEEDSKEIAFYIIANPVRAGLVQSPDDYPFSGSDAWTIRELIEWVTRT